MKNSNDTIWNRTRDLPTCSAVPQPTALFFIVSFKTHVSQAYVTIGLIILQYNCNVCISDIIVSFP